MGGGRGGRVLVIAPPACAAHLRCARVTARLGWPLFLRWCGETCLDGPLVPREADQTYQQEGQSPSGRQSPTAGPAHVLGLQWDCFLVKCCRMLLPSKRWGSYF